MIVRHPRGPARELRSHAREDRLARVELDAMALAVIEADGLDALVALERPGEAGSRVLSP
jgi:hypothetical protein